MNNKKIAFLIAWRDFQDIEYFVTKRVLQKSGAKVITVSVSLGTAVGYLGGEAEVDLLLDDIEVGKFDAVIFIGGQGCLEYLNNETSYVIAREVLSKGKILAAICISPVILAEAGLLKNKKATVWSDTLEKGAIRDLEKGGAIYQREEVVIDGNIITASGPPAAKDFAKSIIEALTS